MSQDYTPPTKGLGCLGFIGFVIALNVVVILVVAVFLV